MAVIASILGAHLLGITVCVITGSSMEDAISKGSLAIERRIPSHSLQVGDVITFQPPDGGGSVTHRIVSIEAGKDGQRMYQTKGDANEAEDPWLFTLDRPDQIKVLTSIPLLGYILAAFTLRMVRTALLLAVALQLIAYLIMWVKRRTAEDDDQFDADDGLAKR